MAFGSEPETGAGNDLLFFLNKKPNVCSNMIKNFINFHGPNLDSKSELKS